MIPYTLLAVTLMVALVSMVFLYRAILGSIPSRWHRLLLSASMAVFVYLFGAWVFLSIYLKYIFAAVYLSIGLVVFVTGKTTGNSNTCRSRMWPNLVFAGIFSSLSVLYFTGTTGAPYGIAHLRLPLKNGRFIIFQGGKGLPTNIFHYGLRGAVYAVDLVRLNSWGNRANSIFSTRLEDYAIFNDTVYAPCSGIILHTTDINPDNIPPARKRGPTNTNHVLIETDSFYVFMGHLKYHEVFVRTGDLVGAGQPLGLAGNSGFSLEPHLHIQVHARTGTGLPWYKERPLWIEFNGKSYLLFDVIDAR